MYVHTCHFTDFRQGSSGVAYKTVRLHIHNVLSNVQMSYPLSFGFNYGTTGISPYISIFTASLSYCPIKIIF